MVILSSLPLLEMMYANFMFMAGRRLSDLLAEGPTLVATKKRDERRLFRI